MKSLILVLSAFYSIQSFALTAEEIQLSCMAHAEAINNQSLAEIEEEDFNGVSGNYKAIDDIKEHFFKNPYYQVIYSPGDPELDPDEEYSSSVASIAGDILLLKTKKKIMGITKDSVIHPAVNKYILSNYPSNKVIIDCKKKNNNACKIQDELAKYLTAFTMGKNLRTQEELNSYLDENFKGQNQYTLDEAGALGSTILKAENWTSLFHTETNQCSIERCEGVLSDLSRAIILSTARDYGLENPVFTYKATLTKAKTEGSETEIYSNIGDIFLLNDELCKNYFDQGEAIEPIYLTKLIKAEPKSADELAKIATDDRPLTKTDAVSSPLRREQKKPGSRAGRGL